MYNHNLYAVDCILDKMWDQLYAQYIVILPYGYAINLLIILTKYWMQLIIPLYIYGLIFKCSKKKKNVLSMNYLP